MPPTNPDDRRERPILDRGEADPEVRVALASAYEGEDAYARAIAVLCTARLILPTVPAPPDAEPGLSKAAEDHEHPGERPESGDSATSSPGHPEMAAVLLRSASGDRGVCVFTGYDSLHAWRADAHPVRCTLDDVAATVHETGSSAIVVDVAGPHPLVIEGVVVDELARGRRIVELPEGGFAWMWLNSLSGSD